MLTSAIAALVFAQAGPSLFSQLFSSRDVTNGYQDYVIAADMAKTKNLRELTRSDAPVLEKAKKIAVLMEPMIKLIEDGNRKPATRTGLEDWTSTFPELTHFRELLRGTYETAYAEAAAGQWQKSTSTILTGLKFSRRLDANIIFRLVGIAGDGVGLMTLSRTIPRLPVPDLERLDRELDQMLRGDESTLNAISGEIGGAIKMFTDFQKDPRAHKEFLVNAEGEEPETSKKLRELSPQDLAREIGSAISILRDVGSRAIETLKQPEKNWVIDVPTVGFLDDLMPDYTGWLSVMARSRTQLRLARLMAKVELYRWQHARLPGALKDFTAEADRHDPLSGKDFVYAQTGSGSYEIYSEGGLEQGRIDLVYTRSTPQFPAEP
ncbi:MAG: hypothetical protein JNJ45_04815 [Chthonomonas sp.]|nr:hypothetical protein [Chthonomonas sp.]